MAGKADLLPSGDQDLLALADTFVCPAVTAEQLLQALAESPPQDN
ncbi:MAG: hypothetical protein ACLGG1_01660 [Gammaproteobacteria bacterium]